MDHDTCPLTRVLTSLAGEDLAIISNQSTRSSTLMALLSGLVEWGRWRKASLSAGLEPILPVEPQFILQKLKEEADLYSEYLRKLELRGLLSGETEEHYLAHKEWAMCRMETSAKMLEEHLCLMTYFGV